jgi:hypothetical protein
VLFFNKLREALSTGGMAILLAIIVGLSGARVGWGLRTKARRTRRPSRQARPLSPLPKLPCRPPSSPATGFPARL